MTRLAWIPHLSPAYALAVALRHEVLRVPLGLRFTEAQLASEADSHHLALFDGERLVGTLLLTPREGGAVQMRQVAVDPNRQGGGVGRSLVEEAERFARQQGFARMTLHARDTAVGFYERLGYAAVGDPFVEVGIPHQGMEKPLD
ncbi:MAG TPA: GNAT family N-acetyltransferase [Holophagaceae bacterium]|nr:GNAT family N-acetyltransferase [Holophagaceae bacterium]